MINILTKLSVIKRMINNPTKLSVIKCIHVHLIHDITCQIHRIDKFVVNKVTVTKTYTYKEVI